MNFLLMSIILASALILRVNGLSCHQCDTMTGTNCDNANIEKRKPTTCTGSETGCSKVETSGTLGSSVVRACTSTTANRCDSATLLGTTVTTCFCTTDECNASGRTQAAHILTFLSILLSFFALTKI